MLLLTNQIWQMMADVWSSCPPRGAVQFQTVERVVSWLFSVRRDDQWNGCLFNNAHSSGVHRFASSSSAACVGVCARRNWEVL